MFIHNHLLQWPEIRRSRQWRHFCYAVLTRRFFTLLAPPLASARRRATEAASIPHAGPARAAPSPATAGPGLALKGGATLLVICLLAPFGVRAEEGVEHPLIGPKDIKPETCLTCHPEKKEGQFIHTAVRIGCENCHQITSAKDKTTITLFATGGELCAKCHEAKKDRVLHGPYKNGQCLICHDPHSSQFVAHTRSGGNSLCLECHAPRPATADMVSLFSFRRISKADFEAIPKIELDPTLTFGHPCATHPVAQVADPLHAGERMSCLSCHAPHASMLPNLLVLPKGGGDACDACHRAIDKQKQAKPGSQPQQQPQPTPNLPTQFTLKGCRDCRNSFGGDRCAE
jgi:predicted CXXCH cytochrome family protein